MSDVPVFRVLKNEVAFKITWGMADCVNKDFFTIDFND